MKIKIREFAGVALAVTAILFTGQVGANEFRWGTLDGSFDTTVSYGLQMRVAERDENLIGKARLNPAVAGMSPEDFIAAPGAFSVNGDLGNLNYDQDELVSNAFKVTSEFSLRGRYMGFFARGFYFYDLKNSRDASGLSEAAQRRVGERGDLLDMFIYGDWSLGERGTPFSLRFGRQVVNWGESTFIQGGLNAINPFDVSMLRVPGSELREALLPVNSLWSSVGITDDVSVELFYQFMWKPVLIDAPGTFFSTANFVGAGADGVMLGFGQFTEAQAPQLEVPRAQTQEARNKGQYGAALRWFVEDWDTELGFYYLRYHSRLPIISGIAVTDTNPNSGRYFTEYPEDIDLYGVSYNTVVRGIALQGEYSYRHNAPLQIDDVELLFHALSPLNALLPDSPFLSQLGEASVGEVLPGFVRHKVGQAQTTATWLAGANNPFRAAQWVLIGEVGVTHVYDLPDKSVLRYEGPGTSTGGGADRTTGDLRNPVTQTTGFADATSWGYRLATRVDYNNAIGAWNMSPRAAFAHDVDGTSPGPGGNFVDGRKSYTLGVNFNRLETFSVDASFTRFFGGGLHNLIRDRDFVALEFKYSF